FPHDYPDNAAYTAMLAVPIVVAQSNAYVSFDEVVLVEPGEAGSVYGDGDFWDYVILEGSKDGVTWVPIADGYDSRRDAAWVTAWNSGTPGSSSLLRPHVFDLHDAFAVRDTILLRWRFYADGAVNGWGWVVDNLSIQVGSPTGADEGTPARGATLAQNAPNPFNPSTVIRFSLPQAGPVSLRIYDVRGRQVRSLVEGIREAGAHSVVWDGRDDRGGHAASGAYVYRLQADGKSQQRNMMLVR
ncbi:T9SS type A sorting domain-containing protein, partial [bacterium]|nr:T9SS type A sorting domain-containing protein [bacterium]